jgi:methylmalonyl-CoA mutase C-terminal domain/subunit
MDARPTRVLVAKIGLDGHDRGARVISRALRDAGMEIIYTGRHMSPREIARIAMDEDVDIIGLSILSGAHVSLTASLIKELDDAADDVNIVVGGTIATQEVRDELFALGVKDVFTGGTPLSEVVSRMMLIAERIESDR